MAETNAPERPEDGKGIKGWFFKRFQKKAGGAVPSANRITLLRDLGDNLYVANSDAVVRFPYKEGETKIAAPGDERPWLTPTLERADSKSYFESAVRLTHAVSASSPTAESAWR